VRQPQRGEQPFLLQLRHVEFRRVQDGSFTVADVGSLNGTYVNRERIDQVALSNGDEVQIGKYRLVFYASQRGY
jgi:pSer/pThr/pTyr-binding forkhead associated (FHA) protein